MLHYARQIDRAHCAAHVYTLLYKVPSKSTGTYKLCYKRKLLLPVEFITKHFLKYLTPEIEVITVFSTVAI